MVLKGIFMKKAVVFAAILASVGAHAQTGQKPVNAIAGLSPVLILTCQDVNFGVWRVPAGDRAGITSITLTTNGDLLASPTTATIGGVSDQVSLASGYQVPTAGHCKLEGSNGYQGSSVEAFINSNTNIAFTTSTHDNLKAPVATAAGVTANLSLSNATPAITADGEANFRIVGTLTIPNNLVRANYGGYRSATPANVSVTDAPVVAP